MSTFFYRMVLFPVRKFLAHEAPQCRLRGEEKVKITKPFINQVLLVKFERMNSQSFVIKMFD